MCARDCACVRMSDDSQIFRHLVSAPNVLEPGVGVTMVRICGVGVAGAGGRRRAGWPAASR